MRKLGSLGLWTAATLLVTGNSAWADIAGLERVASGLNAPLFATHAPGDQDHLFVLERGGNIKIVDLDGGDSSTFLTVAGTAASQFDEGGLLGLAFHPNYATEGMSGFGKFYVYVTVNDSVAGAYFTSHIREYQVMADDPNVADPGSLREILRFNQPQGNHNAGWIGFSPNDGYLYVASGDGGGGGDTGTGHTAGIGNAQDITDNLLGKMLRIDVDDTDGDDDFPLDAARNYRIPDTNPFADVRDPDTREVTTAVTGDDEIWAFGLRNPFRDSFDRLTGDLWIGDVGQGAREEIDRQPFDALPGDNFGWRLCEGNLACTQPADYRGPVYDYARPLSDPPPPDPVITEINKYRGTVVTGGYVYRGPDPTLQGQYFFLDSRNSASAGDDNYWMFEPTDPYGSVLQINELLTPNVGSPQFPVSFGEDAKGNLYIAYLVSGDVYRIVTDALLPGDYDADGDVDDDDYQEWKNAFGTSAALPDGNGNGIVDAADYTVWRDNLGRSVHDPAGAAASAAGQAAVPEPAASALCAPLLGLMLLGVSRRGRI
jgi:glucose/arabinose dehydrogenase